MTHPYSESDDYNDISEEEVTLHQQFVIPDTLRGQRLDAALAHMLPDYSRNRLTQWLKQGLIQMDGETPLPKTKVLGGEHLAIHFMPNQEALPFQPEPMALPIIFEDEYILVINKPANLVVHPGAGNANGTLLNGLLHYCPDLAQLPRAGIVHRLDKDTTGLMVIAKTLPAQTDLVRQLQNRSVKRVYRAIANGIVPFDGKIDTQIGRDPHNRLKMAVLKFGGKQAITHIRVLERYLSHSYIECQLETGRTHQIRVHMAAAKHPLAADPLYGNPRHKMSATTASVVKQLNRQALHAYSLELIHPATGETRNWSTPLPDDINTLLTHLRNASHQVEYGKNTNYDDKDQDDATEIIYAR